MPRVGAPAGGVHAIARRGTRQTPHRGVYGNSIWFQCLELRKRCRVFLWNVYISPKAPVATIERFLDSISPILRTQATAGNVIMGGDLNIRPTDPTYFPEYATQDLVPERQHVKSAAIWSRLRADGWRPIAHPATPFPYTFKSRASDARSQPDHVLLFHPRPTTHGTCAVQHAPKLSSGRISTDHHLVHATIQLDKELVPISTDGQSISRKLPPPTHILWDAFKATERAIEAENPKQLHAAAKIFFGSQHPMSLCIPTEVKAAMKAREARIAAWKALRRAQKAGQLLEGSPSSELLRTNLHDALRASKKAWRHAKRTYTKRCKMKRSHAIDKQIQRRLLQGPQGQQPDPANFLAHQRLTMGHITLREVRAEEMGEPAPSDDPQHPFTIPEAELAIERLACNRMPGPHGLPAELAKAFPKMFAQHAVERANHALKTGTWPTAWATATGQAVPKPNADKDDPATFRLIAALPTVAKIVTYMLLQRIKHHVQPAIPLQQTGFAPQTRVELAVSGAAAFFAAAKSNGQTVLATTVDIRKAFDTVDRQLLLQKLETVGVPEEMSRLLRNYLSKTKVLLPAGEINYQRGVVQGCVLSPLLFALYTADIAKSVHGPTEGSEQALFLYADDILLLSTKPEEHAATLQRIVEEVNKIRLQVHPNKCRTLITGTRRAQQRCWKRLLHHLPNSLKALFQSQCAQMRYLGYTLTPYGIQAGDSQLLERAKTVASKLSALALSQSLGPEDLARAAKTHLVPLLDWGYAVPTRPGGRLRNWRAQDAAADQVISKAVSGPTFGALTSGPRKIPYPIIGEALSIQPASSRRAKLAQGLANLITQLPDDHPTAKCVRIANRGDDQCDNLTSLLAERSMHCDSPPAHASVMTWDRNLTCYGDCLKALSMLHRPELRRAMLKLRTNTNTFCPGDAIRMMPSSEQYCQCDATERVKDTLHHRLLACSFGKWVSIRSRFVREMDLAIGSRGRQRTQTTVSILEYAAYGCTNKLKKACTSVGISEERADVGIMRLVRAAASCVHEIILASKPPAAQG